VTKRSASRYFPLDDPAAEGHFPGNPIIPGAALLREVVNAVSPARGMICHEIRSAKFLRPVRPGDQVTIVWEEKAGVWEEKAGVWEENAGGEVSFTCFHAERRVLAGTLRIGPR
jgi:3-hydroxyacyl-[acyl-carrier-protein] dehydratase